MIDVCILVWQYQTDGDTDSGYPMWCNGSSDRLGIRRPGFEPPLGHGNSLRGVELGKPLLKYLIYLEKLIRVTISEM